MELAKRTVGLATMVFDKHRTGLNGGRYTVMMGIELHPLARLAARYKRDNPKSRVHRQQKLVTKRYDLDEDPDVKPFSVEKTLEPNIVLKILPKVLLTRLLADPLLKMAMHDGMGSDYEAKEAKINIKGTHDFIHEIGHHAWSYYLPGVEEVAQRDAVIGATPDDHSTRHTLPFQMVPQRQKAYSQLVDGHDGQRLVAGKVTRATDLDEHFARNFDYLIKRKPLSVMPAKSLRDIRKFLEFYLVSGLIDQEFVDSYMYIAGKEGAGGRFFKIESPSRFQDGDSVTMDRIALIHVLDAERRVGRQLTLTEELAIRLDLTLGFAEFALAKDKTALIKTLELYRTDEPELIDRIRANR